MPPSPTPAKTEAPPPKKRRQRKASTGCHFPISSFYVHMNATLRESGIYMDIDDGCDVAMYNAVVTLFERSLEATARVRKDANRKVAKRSDLVHGCAIAAPKSSSAF